MYFIFSLDISILDQLWVAQHVVRGTYCYFISKCSKGSCCKPYRSKNIQAYAGSSFPFPRVVEHQEVLEAIEPELAGKSQGHFASLLLLQANKSLRPSSSLEYDPVPFDLYLPSASGTFRERTCRICGLYDVSAAASKRHFKACNNAPLEETKEPISDDDESDYEQDNGSQVVSKGSLPLITDMQKWFFLSCFFP